jgi:hypothetical protein
MKDEIKIETLFENAREELMKRVEFRDKYLKQCLIALVVIFALGDGIEIEGVKGDAPNIWIYLFSYPVAFFFMTLYIKEENLVGNLSMYIADLNKNAHRGKSKDEFNDVWDASRFLQQHLRSCLHYRLLSTLCAFVILPGLLVVNYFVRQGFRERGSWVLLGVSCGLAVVAVIYQVIEYKRRAIALTTHKDSEQKP